MEVRKAQIDDLPAISALVERYWRFERIAGFRAGHVREALEKLLEGELGEVWISIRSHPSAERRSEAQRAIEGYLILVYVFSLEHGGLTAEIDEFFVQRHARSRGQGARLLAAAEQAARRRGCANLSLQVGTRNARAKHFYLREGFLERREFELLEKHLADRRETS